MRPRGVCGFPDCGRPRSARGLCKAHHAQLLRGKELIPIVPRPPKKRLTDEQLDGALLLIARGAPTDYAAAYFSVSVKQLRNQLEAECHEAWRDADDARWTTPHGTTSRYRRGCRCRDCKDAQRDDFRRRNPGAGDKKFIGQRDRHQDHLRNLHGERVRQADTVTHAANGQKQWTGPEMEFLLTSALPIKERAIKLGRTMYAVRRRLSLIRNDPKWMKATGVDDY